MKTIFSFRSQFLLLLFPLFISVPSSVNAQIPALKNISVKTTVEAGTSPVLVNGEFSFDLKDTIGVSSLELLVGSTQDSSDVVSNDFLFDVTSGLPSTLSYQREFNRVTLGVADLLEFLT
jgi:hypothetical protein